jgi:dolichol kinase
MAKREEPKTEETRGEEKKIEEFGTEMYLESAKALRQVGARVFLSIGAAILIWIFGEMIFLPIAKEMTQEFMGYPVHSIISLIIVIALAIIIFTVFIDIRRLTGGMAGVLAYHFGKASHEMSVETYKNYRTALDGILYVIMVSLAYLLFANYLAEISPVIPAVLLILIVIWAVFALWRSCKAIATVIGRYTSRWADELEKQVKKA